MMKQGNRLLFMAVFGALVLPLIFIGTGWAKTIPDGSKPNAAGLWDITDYGQCIAGVRADGTMVVDTAHNLSRPDCIDHTYTGADYNSLTNCTKYSGRSNADDVSHYWGSVCVDGSGNGVNLDGLDRTTTNCILKGGTMQNACTGSWIYTGSGTSNNPVLGSGAPGFCYTTIDLSSIYANQAACPTTLGYAWNTTLTKCTHVYGIAGYLAGPVTNKDGSAGLTAGIWVDLSTLTQGTCSLVLAPGSIQRSPAIPVYGYSWSTGVVKGATASVATTPIASTTATQMQLAGRAGCLECHNTVSQNNGYAERWKEPYLMHGHKNMLRKVTPGQPWAGPDSVIYTQAASVATPPAVDYQNLDFSAGTATTTLWGTRPLMYLFGDWMAPAPGGLDTVVWRADLGGARYNGVGTGYSCAACHSTGWSNPTAGLCSNPAFTTLATCTTPDVWVASSGMQGALYAPLRPGLDWAGNSVGITVNPDNSIPGITGRWDWDGIMCARCHYSGFSEVNPTPSFYFQGSPTGQSISTHNRTPASTANQQVNNICFGCHQSIAKNTSGTGTVNDLNPLALQVKNVAVAPATYVPEFNSHPIGNQFLGSPHALYAPATPGIYPNPFGKYDLNTNAPTQYASTFTGDICRSAITAGGGSILAEVWNNVDSTNTRITSLQLCNLANGFGTIAAPDSVNRGYWQSENKGACTSCHQVHESLFDPNAQEPFKEECTSCHDGTKQPNKPLAQINHPTTGYTPVGIALREGIDAEACIICHMPKATSGGFPMHLWRIKSDVDYSTFPTSAEFLGNTKKVANTSPDGSYTQAVWVDVDLACGQCHGGGTVSNPKPAAVVDGVELPWFPKVSLAAYAAGIHQPKTPVVASFTVSYDSSTPYNVDFDASGSTCPSGNCTYSWDFTSDGTNEVTGVTATATNTYPNATTQTVKLTVKDNNQGNSATTSKSVTPRYVNKQPVAAFTKGGFDANTWVATLTNTSNDGGDGDISTVTFFVTWGDGSSETRTGLSNPTFSHTYTTAGTYAITMRATDSAGLTSTDADSVIAAGFSISGTVTAGPAGSSNVNSVLIQLKFLDGRLAANTYTPSSGGSPLSYSFTGVKPGTYTVTASKTGAEFASPNPITGIVVGGNATAQNFATVKTKFKASFTAKGSGTPGANISGVTIKVFNSGGTLVAQGVTNTSGVYETAMTLTAGNYSATAYKAGRLWNNSPSPITLGPADGVVTFVSTTQ